MVRVVDESPFVEEAMWEQEKDGYELVTAYPQDGCVRLYFKRPASANYRAALELIARGHDEHESFSGTRCAEIARDALAK